MFKNREIFPASTPDYVLVKSSDAEFMRLWTLRRLDEIGCGLLRRLIG